MNSSSFFRCWSGLLLAAMLAGCNSIDSRINENRGTFAKLSPEAQQTIRDGQISIGFTSTMVYMALGKPNEINTSADGTETTWTYIHFNTPEGGLAIQPEAFIGTQVGAQMAFDNIPRRPMIPPPIEEKPYHGVAGENDLYRGRVRPQDDRIREATPRDMIRSETRQDLLVQLRGGYVVGFDLVPIF